MNCGNTNLQVLEVFRAPYPNGRVNGCGGAPFPLTASRSAANSPGQIALQDVKVAQTPPVRLAIGPEAECAE
jgi:hypothetical protein